MTNFKDISPTKLKGTFNRVRLSVHRRHSFIINFLTWFSNDFLEISIESFSPLEHLQLYFS